MTKDPGYFFLKIEVKFTLHKINYFKVYNSVTFSIFTVLGYHHTCLIPEHFHHPTDKLDFCLAVYSLLPTPSSLWKPLICFLSLDLPILDISYE